MLMMPSEFVFCYTIFKTMEIFICNACVFQLSKSKYLLRNMPKCDYFETGLEMNKKENIKCESNTIMATLLHLPSNMHIAYRVDYIIHKG